jgi:hypothetical protein
MTSAHHSGSDHEHRLEEGAERRDWLWAGALLAGLAGLTWMFDRVLHFF